MAGNQEQSRPPNPAAESAGRNRTTTTALYIGDLEANVTESQLYVHFSQIGQLHSVRVCRPKSSTKKPLNYGYVNYFNSQDAEMALEKLNLSVLNGKRIRVMHGNRDFGGFGNEGESAVFVKNLDKGVDSKALVEIFREFGNVLSCKVATDNEGESKGYGFVQFDDEECVQRAVQGVDGMVLNGERVLVVPYLRRVERVGVLAEGDERSVFVKNLAEWTGEEDLSRVFGGFGELNSVKVMRDKDGKSRCFGFVNFVSGEDALKAIEGLNGVRFHGKEWYAGKARKKSEAVYKGNQSVLESVDKYQQGANLYVKNLDPIIEEDMLKELFAPFGSITSLKVVKNVNGISQGVGFVAFTTPDEASKALADVNGKVVIDKPLYVAFAERKEERRAKLLAEFSKTRPSSPPPVVLRIPVDSPRPGLDKRDLYCQMQSPVIPQPDFGYPQNLLPAVRPNEPLAPSLFLLENQHLIPNIPQQILPGGVHGFSNGQGFQMPGVPILGVDRGMLVSPLHEAPRSSQTPIRNLATSLASASPNQQKTMLRNTLYPLVQQIYPYMAATVTDILSKMDPTVVLHLLESPEALKATVAKVLEQYWLLHEAPRSSHTPPIRNLVTWLASASPEQQQTMLRNTLYPLVQQIYPDMAAIVTDMLSKMDPTVILYLLESPEALKATIAKVLELLVLRI